MKKPERYVLSYNISFDIEKTKRAKIIIKYRENGIIITNETETETKFLEKWMFIKMGLPMGDEK